MGTPEQPPPPPVIAPACRVARLALVAGLLLGCVACDRATKSLAMAQLQEGHRLSYLSDCVRLERVWNAGSFLGLGAELPEGVRAVLFTFGVGGLAASALLVALRRRASTRTACAAALVAAGGAGNLWDRVAHRGWVIDFMNLGVGPLRTGIFNVADLAIVLGALLLLLVPAARARPGG